jgi:hypothetical protein
MNVLKPTIMKKNIISLVLVSSLISAAVLTGCRPSTSREEAAQAELKQAKIELAEAQRAANATEWQSFKDESEIKIKDNAVRISSLKLKITKSGKALDKLYQEKVEALELQNKALEAKMNDYEKTGKNNWQSFKREFNHDMDELGNAMKDLTTNNTK